MKRNPNIFTHGRQLSKAEGVRTAIEWLYSKEMPLTREPALKGEDVHHGYAADSGWEGFTFDVSTDSEAANRLPKHQRRMKRRRPVQGKNPRLEVALRAIQVVDNRKLFGRAEVTLNAFVVDGKWKPGVGLAVSQKSWTFPSVASGEMLSIGPSRGVTLYQDRPQHFLNLHIIALRNTQRTRDFASVLKDQLSSETAKGIVEGAVGALGVGGPAAEAIKEASTTAVEAAVSYYAKAGNPIIGVFYESLTGTRTQYSPKWGVGVHPGRYPPEMIECGGAMRVAYEVSKAP